MTKMNQSLSITFTKIPGHDDTAFILEVIAREIRRGNTASNETGFSWIRGPSSIAGRVDVSNLQENLKNEVLT